VSFTAAKVQSVEALRIYETGKFCDNLCSLYLWCPATGSLARVGSFSYWNNYHAKLVQQSPLNYQLVFLLSMRMQSRGRRRPPFWTSSSTFHNLFRVSPPIIRDNASLFGGKILIKINACVRSGLFTAKILRPQRTPFLIYKILIWLSRWRTQLKNAAIQLKHVKCSVQINVCAYMVLFLFIVSALAVRFIVPKIVALNHNAEFTSAAG
jgi:hypothetical protein